MINYFKDSNGEFFGLKNDGSQDHLIKADFVPVTLEEIKTLNAGKNSKIKSVTMRQARLALLETGHLALIPDIIEQLPEPMRSRALIEWEYASHVSRDNVVFNSIADALDLSETEKDDLFILAASYE